jgi:hypothetical protein
MPAPPESPPLDFERRKAHLLAEVARSHPPSRPPLRALHRPLVLVGALVLALSGAAFAVGARLDDLDAFFDYFGGDAEDRAVVARGDEWAFATWMSTEGLCTSLVFPGREGSAACGIPVVGAPRKAAGPEHVVVGGTYRGRSDDLWISGVAAANVSRVEVELVDGRRLEATVYDAPATLGLDLKFFLVRTRVPVQVRPAEPPNPPGLEIPTPAVRAFSAYDARGILLERYSPATATK